MRTNCDFINEFDEDCKEPATWEHVYTPDNGVQWIARYCDHHTVFASRVALTSCSPIKEREESSK